MCRMRLKYAVLLIVVSAVIAVGFPQVRKAVASARETVGQRPLPESETEAFAAPKADDSETAAALDTIAQINHINWVVSKIKTYNNVLVLEEEYKKCSPGQLNLDRRANQRCWVKSLRCRTSCMMC